MAWLLGGVVPVWMLPGAVCAAWALAHYAASHVYVQLCTPLSFVGFVSSPLMVSSPQCASLRWFIQTGAANISAFWVTAGATAVALLGSQ